MCCYRRHKDKDIVGSKTKYYLQSYKMGKTGEINETSQAYRYKHISVFEALSPKRHANEKPFEMHSKDRV